MFSKKSGNASAEHFYKEAENHKNQLKAQLRSFLGTGAIVIAAVIAIAAASVAWFANNSSVSGSGAQIQASNNSVVLRTKGENGIHDDVLKRLLGSDGEQGFWYSVANDVRDAAAAETSVNWLLSDASNIGNFEANTDHTTYWNSEEDRQTKAIEPGSSGKLTFYVVPKYSGDVSLSLRLSMIPYKVTNDGYTEVTDTEVEGFLSGHIMFFLVEKDENNQDTLRPLEDGVIPVDITSAVEDEEYEYTLYWCWPQTFSEAVMKSGDPFLYSKNTLFSDFSNGAVIRSWLTTDNNNSQSMIKAPESYFYSNLTKAPLAAYNPLVSKIGDIYNESSEDLTEDEKNAYVELSSYYNQADQFIGKKVSCVRIKLALE